MAPPGKPQTLQLLAILPLDRQGPWLRACLVCGGGQDIQITQVTSLREAAAATRERSFDLALLWHEGSGEQAEEQARILSSLPDLHGGFVALGMQTHEGWHAPLLEAGATVCLDLDQTDPQVLVSQLRNTAELLRLRTAQERWENQRLLAQNREAQELDRLLSAQRSLLMRLDAFQQSTGAQSGMVGERLMGAAEAARDIQSSATQAILAQHYTESLRSYMFDDSTSIRTAISNLAGEFRRLQFGSHSIMRLHLETVSTITEGGGAGSLRHCLAQADRFLIELLLQMVEYQQNAIPQADKSRVQDRSGLVNSPSIAA